MAAEQDTSMQGLVAAIMQREVVKHIRERAGEKALAAERKRTGTA